MQNVHIFTGFFVQNVRKSDFFDVFILTFNAIQDDIELKHLLSVLKKKSSFNTIQDDIELKLNLLFHTLSICFNTIQDDIELKLCS